MEPHDAARRQAVPASTSSTPRSRTAPAGPVPGRVPEPRGPQGADRADLVAILLTGLPNGIVPGFQNYTGPTYADMLRLNLADPAGGASRTRWASSAATSPDSPTGAGPSTTSSRSSCAPSPASRTRWSLRPTSRTPRRPRARTARGAGLPRRRSRTWRPRTTASPQSHDRALPRPPAPPGRGAQRLGRAGAGARGRRRGARRARAPHTPGPRGRRDRGVPGPSTAAADLGPASTSPSWHGRSAPRACTPPSTPRCARGAGSCTTRTPTASRSPSTCPAGASPRRAGRPRRHERSLLMARRGPAPASGPPPGAGA